MYKKMNSVRIAIEKEGITGLLECLKYLWLYLKGCYQYYILNNGKVEVEGIEFSLVSVQEAWKTNATYKNENAFLKAILSELSEGDIFWDVGAYIGFYSLFAGKNGAEVVAFEPNPISRRRLIENIQLNDLSIKTTNIALSDSKGKEKFNVVNDGKPDDGAHLGGQSNHSVIVKTMPGDNLGDDFKTPDVIKIDVEGAEYDVVKGLKETLRNCRVVFCEVHPLELRRFGYSEEEFEKLIRDLNFTIQRVPTGGIKSFSYHWRCVNDRHG